MISHIMRQAEYDAILALGHELELIRYIAGYPLVRIDLDRARVLLAEVRPGLRAAKLTGKDA